MKFSVVGNSHVGFFSGTNDMAIGDPKTWRNTKDRNEKFETYPMGAHLCYNLNNKQHPGRRDFENILGRINQSNPLILMYGEIDCRNHLVLQAENMEKSFIYAVHLCIKNYMEFIDWLIKHSRVDPIILWGPHPPMLPGTKFKKGWKKMSNLHFGTYDEVCYIEYLFNNVLAYECEKRDRLVFATLYYRMMEYFMNEEPKFYAPDDFHLSQEMYPYAVEELNNVLGVEI